MECPALPYKDTSSLGKGIGVKTNVLSRALCASNQAAAGSKTRNSIPVLPSIQIGTVKRVAMSLHHCDSCACAPCQRRKPFMTADNHDARRHARAWLATFQEPRLTPELSQGEGPLREVLSQSVRGGTHTATVHHSLQGTIAMAGHGSSPVAEVSPASSPHAWTQSGRGTQLRPCSGVQGSLMSLRARPINLARYEVTRCATSCHGSAAHTSLSGAEATRRQAEPQASPPEQPQHQQQHQQQPQAPPSYQQQQGSQNVLHQPQPHSREAPDRPHQFAPRS